MKKTLLVAATVAGLALPFAASASPCEDGISAGPGGCTTAVPEISALEGAAALAALGAVVLLTWERRRRAL